MKSLPVKSLNVFGGSSVSLSLCGRFVVSEGRIRRPFIIKPLSLVTKTVCICPVCCRKECPVKWHRKPDQSLQIQVKVLQQSLKIPPTPKIFFTKQQSFLTIYCIYSVLESHQSRKQRTDSVQFVPRWWSYIKIWNNDIIADSLLFRV